MASRIDQNKQEFEITYEAPWGGINVDADPSDIQINQLQDMNNVRIKQNVIMSSQFNVNSNVNFTHPTAGNYYVGMTSLNGILVFFDNAGNILQYDTVANQMNIITATTIQQFSAYKAINGYIYISDYLGGAVYQYQPLTNTTGTLTTGAFYVGGKYAAVLVNYLLLANSNQPSDTPAIKPARVSWSSPDDYTEFNAAVDRTAGYNVLGDVQDSITGLFVQGNVGYILRTQGITQFSPTGDPLGPFAFTALWGDDFGVGCNLPDTLSTYGPQAVFANDTGIYQFSGGLEDISHGIKQYLEQALLNIQADNSNASQFVSGVIHGSAQSDIAADIKYSFLAAYIQRTLVATYNLSAYVFVYGFRDKVWTRQVVDVTDIVDGEVTSLTYMKIFRAPRVEVTRSGLLSNRYVSTRYVPYILVSGVYGSGTAFNLVLQLFDGSAANNTILSPLNLVFKAHEFKLARKPTVNRVLVKAAGTGTLNVTITTTQTINGVVTSNVATFTPINLASSNTVAVFSSSGAVTGENPQLTITSPNFAGTIVKVLMKGVFADGDII